MKLQDMAGQSDPHAEIKKWLDNHYIKNYTIRPDGIVDVSGKLDLNCTEMILPVQFGKVGRDFDCRKSNLISLKGMPQFVGHDFFCNNDKIKSLSGIDKIIKHIGYEFYCDPDVTHILGLLLIQGITYIDVDGVEGPVDKIMNKYIGIGDILSAQDELIDAGFTDQARL
jgi:hypothetical protein